MLTYVELKRIADWWCKALATGLYRVTANLQFINKATGDMRYTKK